MIDEAPPRPASLGGFRALLAGGPMIGALLLVLHPVTQREDCPNFGGNGNASVFSDARWDFSLPVVFVVWLLLIAAEQFLPSTRRGRGAAEAAIRATIALFVAASGSCCLGVNLATLCH